jgi:hypothetical protein
MNITHEMVMMMPEKRRALFRGAWDWWNVKGSPSRKNSYYSEDNMSL